MSDAADRLRRAVQGTERARLHIARRLGQDVGDGLRGELEVMAAYADVLRAERDHALDDLAALRITTDGYVDLIQTADRHHLDKHPDCEGYR